MVNGDVPWPFGENAGVADLELPRETKKYLLLCFHQLFLIYFNIIINLCFRSEINMNDK